MDLPNDESGDKTQMSATAANKLRGYHSMNDIDQMHQECNDVSLTEVTCVLYVSVSCISGYRLHNIIPYAYTHFRQ